MVCKVVGMRRYTDKQSRLHINLYCMRNFSAREMPATGIAVDTVHVMTDYGVSVNDEISIDYNQRGFVDDIQVVKKGEK